MTTRDGAGAEGAIDRLIRDRSWLESLARRVVVDPHDAADLVQDAALIALTRPPNDSASAKWWLARVVRNLGLNRLRERSRRAAREEATAPPGAVRSPSDLAAEWEVRQRVVDTVLSLDEPYRETVLLRFFEGLSRAETARRQGVSEEAVKTRQRRAFATLRTRLGAEDETERPALFLFPGPALDWVLDPTAPGPTTLDAAAAAAGLGGVLVMTGLKKLAIAAVLLVGLVGGSVLLGSGDDGAGGRRSGVAPNEQTDGTRRRVRPDAPEDTVPAPVPVPEGAAVGATVDFGDVDRARDVHGIVVTPDGAPIPGARVAAVDRPGERWRLLDPTFHESETPGPDTFTDAGGRFRLRLDVGDVVEVRVAAADRATVMLPDVAAGARVRVVLPDAAPLEISVVDSTGEPIADAAVELRRVGRTGGAGYRLRTVTDESGQVHVPDFPEGIVAWLRVTSAKHGESKPRDLTGGSDTQVQIVLGGSERVRGTVVDAATGLPIAGVLVGLHWVQEHPVTTDAEGRFDLPGTPIVEDLDVHASHADYGRGFVRPAPGDEVRIALSRGDVAMGRVVDAAGTAVAEAFVHAFSMHGRGPEMSLSMGSARSATDGSFRIAGLARGQPHGLFVIATGHGRLAIEFAPRDAGPGEIDVGVLRLPGARTLRGSVRGPDGLPLAGRAVTLALPTPSAAGRREQQLRMETDDLGRFVFAGLGPGAHALSVVDSVFGPLSRSVAIEDGGDPASVAFQYASELAAGTFTVRVVDDAGTPIGGITVQLEFNGSSGKLVTTDAEGVGRADVAGPVVLVSVLSSGRSGHIRVDPVHPAKGATGVEIVMSRGERIAGSVVNESGEPVENASVSAHWDGGTGFATDGFTKGDGLFSIVVPRGAEVQLRAQVADRDLDETATRSGALDGVLAGTTGVRLPVALPTMDGAITVRLLAPDGSPLAGEQVMTNPPGGRLWILATADSDGRATFSGLPRIELNFIGYWIPRSSGGSGIAERLAAPVSVRAVPDGQEIVMRARTPATIEGVLVDSDGTPLEGGLVSAFCDDVIANATTDADGRFRLMVPVDRPGPYRLSGSWVAPGTQPTGYQSKVAGVMVGDPDVRIVWIAR